METTIVSRQQLAMNALRPTLRARLNVLFDEDYLLRASPS